MIGIVGYGGYVPRLRLSRKAIFDANKWFAPQLAGKAKGTRSMSNWDEDSITMAVAAARDCLGPSHDRTRVAAVFLASSTLPFAERQNAGIVREALTLGRNVEVLDITGSQRAALSGLSQAIIRAHAGVGETLVLAADNRKTRAASVGELDFGDGAAALLIGRDNVVAEYLGSATVSVDFIDRFRLAGEDIDYVWEERWIRDEGVSKLMPEVIDAVLKNSEIDGGQIDHFIFPTSFQKMETQLAKKCGIKEEAIVDNLSTLVGDTGVPHALLLLGRVLEHSQPGQNILVTQFGNGAQAFIFRVTEAIRSFRPKTGVSNWLARGVEETNYTKFLSFKGQLRLERGMRGEQDKKTALTTLYRHREAILGLVGGQCEKTGEVHFPPSNFSYTPGDPALGTQKAYKLAERCGEILSWSAEYLSFHMSPPHYYGQIDFEGGGRILMEITDVSRGDVESGTKVEMVFRIKDVDELRGFNRYFWKATPVHEQPSGVDKKVSE